MGSDFHTIPIIDINGYLEKIDDPVMVDDKELQDVVRQLDKACKEAGFFYVKNHGIPDSLVKGVKDVTRTFFNLPYEDKLKIKLTAQSGYRGYQRVGENITKGKPDMHEAIDSLKCDKNMAQCYREMKPGEYGSLGQSLEGSNLWPCYPPNFKVLMEEYIYLLRDLSRKIMRGIALALGGPPDAFEREKAGDPFWVMRLIGYPISSDISEIQHTDTGCGAHTDYGLLTLVNQDVEINALQQR